MHWVTSFLEQQSRIDKFNQLWIMMPPCPGSPRFIKSYSQVIQWSGSEMKTLGCAIVPVFAVTVLHCLVGQRILFTEALFCITNFVYSHFMAPY
jgi:anthranilate/para-aminobenzoate synthase component II